MNAFFSASEMPFIESAFSSANLAAASICFFMASIILTLLLRSVPKMESLISDAFDSYSSCEACIKENEGAERLIKIIRAARIALRYWQSGRYRRVRRHVLWADFSDGL